MMRGSASPRAMSKGESFGVMEWIGTCLHAKFPPRLRTHDVLSMQSQLGASKKRMIVHSMVLEGLGRGSDLVHVRESKGGAKHFEHLSALARTLGEGSQPVVVTLDGHITGSSVGLSLHASSCIVTERTRISLPGPAYGFVPESFGAYQLARLPRGLGAYLCLTGASLSGGEMVDLGLATHQTESQSLPRIDEALGCDIRSSN